MNYRKNSELLWRGKILLLLAVFLLSLNSCAKNLVVLTQNEQRPIIKQGTIYKAIWDNKEQDLKAEADRVTMPLGDYLEIQQRLDKCK